MSEFIDYVFQRSTSLNKIDNSLYSKYNVKNGLRNEDGTGVLPRKFSKNLLAGKKFPHLSRQ